MVQWLDCRTCNQKVVGLNPTKLRAYFLICEFIIVTGDLPRTCVDSYSPRMVVSRQPHQHLLSSVLVSQADATDRGVGVTRPVDLLEDWVIRYALSRTSVCGSIK